MSLDIAEELSRINRTSRAKPFNHHDLRISMKLLQLGSEIGPDVCCNTRGLRHFHPAEVEI